jgi:uncharacterized protein YndB with AHSA1/START domain
MATERSHGLAMTRVFDAPRDVVFRAWTDPALARSWWSPRGFTVLACEMDPRPGGAWRVSMRSPSGRIHVERGVFREVVEAERLVFTQAWDDPSGSPGFETLVTVTFEPDGATGTRLRFEQSGFATVRSRDGHEEGWSSCFDRLSEGLAAPDPAGRGASEGAGYRAPPALRSRRGR